MISVEGRSLFRVFLKILQHLVGGSADTLRQSCRVHITSSIYSQVIDNFLTCRNESTDCSYRLTQRAGHDDVISLCDTEIAQGTGTTLPNNTCRMCIVNQ